ncbi:DNA DAMAGE-REPAIR/TOLERATION PROTEIN DRT100 [Salix viminalis]|uniref:DNA DAMAGE-REPAIR/TOLERATION PROTEIN DRT100 n=1 Tax=Salix viminalis TaxID=40686 RepID=A0A9Q0QAL0_SALVM|nr:DNA DAMAGE-REPAIR/TOLERATION PROTEIN DRT100 [Salix viminalis]
MTMFSYTTLLAILTIFISTSAVGSCPPSDRAALLAFKAALHEPYLGIFNSWAGTDCCHNWYGVSCDMESKRVADINLRGESEDPIFQKAGRSGYMNGSISPSICKLKRLSSLTIADWKGISGPIPACITSLPFLRILDLIGNRISGQIPEDIGRLHRLAVLNIADNLLTSRIPRSLTNLSGLMHLDLRNNRIWGFIASRFRASSDVELSGEIPASLGKMAVLATLNLDANKLSGEIPYSLFNSAVGNLNLSKNSFHGYLPDVFGPRSYFMVLDLSYNNFWGPDTKIFVSSIIYRALGFESQPPMWEDPGRPTFRPPRSIIVCL